METDLAKQAKEIQILENDKIVVVWNRKTDRGRTAAITRHLRKVMWVVSIPKDYYRTSTEQFECANWRDGKYIIITGLGGLV